MYQIAYFPNFVEANKWLEDEENIEVIEHKVTYTSHQSYTVSILFKEVE